MAREREEHIINSGYRGEELSLESKPSNRKKQTKKLLRSTDFRGDHASKSSERGREL